MDISRHSGLIFSKRMLGFSIDFQLLIYHNFSIPQHLSLVCLTVGLKNIKILRESARKGNARKPKVRKFWYILEYYCDYDFTYYLLENCSTKRCLCRKSGQVCTYWGVQKHWPADGDEEWRRRRDIDESFWTLVSRLRTFNIFGSHIT